MFRISSFVFCSRKKVIHTFETKIVTKYDDRIFGKLTLYILPVRGKNKTKKQVQSIFIVLNNPRKSIIFQNIHPEHQSPFLYSLSVFSAAGNKKTSDNGNPILIASVFASPAWKRLSNPAILLHKSDCTKTLQLSHIIDNSCLAWVFENQEETSEADWNIICWHVASSWRDSGAKTQTVALSFHLTHLNMN